MWSNGYNDPCLPSNFRIEKRRFADRIVSGTQTGDVLQPEVNRFVKNVLKGCLAADREARGLAENEREFLKSAKLTAVKLEDTSCG